MCRSSPQQFNLVFAMLLCVTTVTNDVVSAAEDLERLPLEVDDVIAIPVEVFGEKQTFCVDTGCSNTIFDTAFRDRLGGEAAQKRIETLNGDFDFLPAPVMKIGAQTPQIFQSSRDVGCLDLSHFRSASGRNIMGMVGMDYLKSRVLRINFDEGVATFPSEANPRSAHVEQIRMGENGIPRIMVWISDAGLQRTMIDTGYNGSVILERKLFGELVDRKRIVRCEESESAVARGVVTRRTGILDEISIGPYRVGNVSVDEGDAITAIGMSCIERFETELDFPNARAYFRPSSRLKQPERFDFTGISMEQIQGKWLIRSVRSGTTAEKCDIHKGDQILEINGKSVSLVAAAKVGAFRFESRHEVKLTLEREGDVRTVTLQVTREPDPFPTPEPLPQLQQAAEALSIP